MPIRQPLDARHKLFTPRIYFIVHDPAIHPQINRNSFSMSKSRVKWRMISISLTPGLLTQVLCSPRLCESTWLYSTSGNIQRRQLPRRFSRGDDFSNQILVLIDVARCPCVVRCFHRATSCAYGFLDHLYSLRTEPFALVRDHPTKERVRANIRADKRVGHSVQHRPTTVTQPQPLRIKLFRAASPPDTVFPAGEN